VDAPRLGRALLQQGSLGVTFAEEKEMATEERKKYQRDWVAKRRQQWFSENGPCKHCGSEQNLELHHVDRKTKEHHAVFSWSKIRREAELSKCIVLCRACHWVETKKQIKEFRPVHHIHGTQTEYRRGCRCEPCKRAKYVAIKNERRRLAAAR
jgi:hypothetical protein